MEILKSKWLNNDTHEFLKGLRSGFSKWIEDLVVCHNDIHQWNILWMNLNKTDLKLIDYEWMFLGFREYDIASVLWELIVDNAHPVFPYTKFYTSNWLEESEFIMYAKYYLSLYFNKIYKGDKIEEEYIEEEIDKFVENMYWWMILYAFHFGISAILLLDESIVNEKVYNFDFVEKRIKMVDFLMNKDFIQRIIKNKLHLKQ